ncbi:MAG: porin family protein [Pseudomonadales bacterium]|nr:porin family protein [Pseudomonadales bacterium]
MKKYSAICTLLFAMVFTPMSLKAEQIDSAEAADSGMQHRVSLYLWAAGMSGDTGNAAGSAPVDLEFKDIFDNLESGFMINYFGKTGKWVFNVDYLTLNITPSSDVPPADVDLNQSFLELTTGYEVIPDLAVVAGFRFVDISTTATIKIGPTLTIKGDDDWVDPIVGIDYRKVYLEKWRLFAHADIGGFGVGSDLSWQLSGFVGYMPSKNWNLYGGYRHLDIDYKSDNAKKFFYNVTVSGPLLGFGYHF